ncbi:MAG TPA: AhpC/TSA family protein [Vicinamibacterales bacterium]|jgi:peroxiredoxin
MHSIDTSSRDAGGNATRAATALLLLTSIHHAYGGYVYHTPWRYHAALVSAVTATVIVGALALWRRRPSALAGRFARIVFLVTTLAIPVIGFGLFEGLYNHVVKNLLYFGGASMALLARLFPPPTYEMPNDVFFEITGVLQVVPAALAAWFLYRTVRPQQSHPILLQRGTAVANRDLPTIGGEVLRIPEADRLVHLQFRRFAGCPVCDLHLQSFVRRREELARAGIREVVVFHSRREELVQYEGDLPFAVVADADRRLYREFGVESSPRALLDPRAWYEIVRGILHSFVRILSEGRPVPPVRPRGGSLGLPADFLIAPDGRIVACKYGRYAADDWSVDDVLGLAVATRAGTEGTAWSAPAVLASWNSR